MTRSSKTGPAEGRDMFGLVFCATAVLWISGQLLWATYQHRVVSDHGEQTLHISKSLCKQEQAIVPVNHSDIWNHILNGSKTEQHRSKVVEWLRGAVKIPTESYDGMEPVGVDPRWEAFKPFHEYLATTFPLVHSTLTLTKVNSWGLVYVWSGTDGHLKPILLTAHQDVVPVNIKTVKDWKYPPYSGHYDGERVWGRGSSDDKSGLIGLLAATEDLIAAGFSPTRSVVLASGFDEESGGRQGARKISEHLLSTFGENAFAFIVDEGGGYQEVYDSVAAFPSVTEKGYLDIQLTVTSPGGHSSVPPDHTSIGLLAALIAELERNPVPAKLSRDDVYYDTLVCMAAHSSGFPKDLREVILESIESDRALSRLEAAVLQNSELRALIGTTTAVDIIGGGVKVNALPEEAWALVNHRIATLSSISEVVDIDTERLTPLAKELGLSVVSFGKHITDLSAPSHGMLNISNPLGGEFQPAPVSPYKDSVVFGLLSGTIKAVYDTHRGLSNSSGSAIKVYPTYMSGNTDTTSYWKLSENIYRYNHKNLDPSVPRGIHTINENILVDELLEMIEFFATLILNADTAFDL